MTPLRRAARNAIEKLLKRFYEGPNPPLRIAEEVELFDRLHPQATLEDWKRFTVAVSENAYRDGFIRGFEWAERDLDAKPKTDPDVIAEELRHAESVGTYTVDELTEEHRAILLDERGIEAGTFRVTGKRDQKGMR